MDTKKTRVLAKTVKGTQIIAVQGYKNEKGEISNYSVAMGYNHPKMKATELAMLQATNASELALALPSHSGEIITAAYNELVESRLKPVEENAHAMGQIEAYTTLASGLKMHNDTLDYHVTGLCLRKKIIAYAIDYKPKAPVKSNDKTLAKRAIEKHINKLNKGAFGNIVMFKLQRGSFSMQKEKIA